MLVTVHEMNDLVLEFVSHLAGELMRSRHTVKRYRGVMEDFVLFLEQEHGKESFDLARMDKATLVRFLRGSTIPGAKASWNVQLSAIRSFYDYLYKCERIDANPAKRVERLRVPKKDVSPLSLDEFVRLVDAAERAAPEFYRYRYVALLQVLYQTALRVAEVASLDIDQVDFEVRAFRGVRRKGGKVLSVEMNDVTTVAIERWLRDRKRMELPHDERALFVSDRGTRLAVRSIEEFVRRYAKEAGITRRVTPHLLRHSSASEHAGAGVDIRTIQDLLAHESVTTTMRYTHPRGGLRRAAMDGLGARYEKRRAHLKRAKDLPQNGGELVV